MASPNEWNKDFGALVAKLEVDATNAAMEAYENAAIKIAAKVINTSPVGIDNSERYGDEPQGKYKANWQIREKLNDKVINKGQPRRQGKRYAKALIKGHFVRNRFKRSLFLFNNSPQASVIEFGGYTKTPKKGTYLAKSKRYEIRSSGGFSKQAPSGHFRKAIKPFNNILRRELKKAFK